MFRLSSLILFVPQPGQSLETIKKIYNKLSHDYCLSRPGDRSICLYTQSMLIQLESTLPQSSLTHHYKSTSEQALYIQQAHQSIHEFISMLRDMLSRSFHYRMSLYTTEITRLETILLLPVLSSSSSVGAAPVPQAENRNKNGFRQLFLTKESVALMYQCMNMPSEALTLYEELYVMLKTSPPVEWTHASHWPFSRLRPSPTPLQQSQPQSSSSRSVSESDSRHTYPSVPTTAPSSSSSQPTYPPTHTDTYPTAAATTITHHEASIWTDVCTTGHNLLHYSINDIRAKVLRNEVNILELHTYLYARQAYFLKELRQYKVYYMKCRRFIKWMYKQLLAYITTISHTSSGAYNMSIHQQQCYVIYNNGLVITDMSVYSNVLTRQAIAWVLTAGLAVVSDYRQFVSSPSSSTVHNSGSSNGNGINKTVFDDSNTPNTSGSDNRLPHQAAGNNSNSSGRGVSAIPPSSSPSATAAGVKQLVRYNSIQLSSPSPLLVSGQSDQASSSSTSAVPSVTGKNGHNSDLHLGPEWHEVSLSLHSFVMYLYQLASEAFAPLSPTPTHATNTTNTDMLLLASSTVTAFFDSPQAAVLLGRTALTHRSVHAYCHDLSTRLACYYPSTASTTATSSSSLGTHDSPNSDNTVAALFKSFADYCSSSSSSSSNSSSSSGGHLSGYHSQSLEAFLALDIEVGILLYIYINFAYICMQV